MGNHHSSFRRAHKKKRKLKLKTSSGLSDTSSSHASSFTSDSSSENSNIESQYFLKNNVGEFDRLQRVHFFAKYIFDEKNLSAPCIEMLESGCRVLDIGCGSGAWVLDCATEFPKSTFVGIDFSPMFPQTIKPYNTMFIQANALERLPLESNSFEIVHLGNMGSCFTEQEWKQNVIPEAMRVIKPGGWVEVLEYGFKVLDVGPCSMKLITAVRTYMNELGINVDFIDQMKDWLVANVEAITDAQEIVVNRSVGNGDKLGAIYADNSIPAMKFISAPLSRILNITEDEYNKLVDGFREEIKVYNHTLVFYKVFARKLANGPYDKCLSQSQSL